MRFFYGLSLIPCLLLFSSPGVWARAPFIQIGTPIGVQWNTSEPNARLIIGLQTDGVQFTSETAEGELNGMRIFAVSFRLGMDPARLEQGGDVSQAVRYVDLRVDAFTTATSIDGQSEGVIGQLAYQRDLAIGVENRVRATLLGLQFGNNSRIIPTGHLLGFQPDQWEATVRFASSAIGFAYHEQFNPYRGTEQDIGIDQMQMGFALSHMDLAIGFQWLSDPQYARSWVVRMELGGTMDVDVGNYLECGLLCGRFYEWIRVQGDAFARFQAGWIQRDYNGWIRQQYLAYARAGVSGVAGNTPMDQGFERSTGWIEIGLQAQY